ncbi:hypothetical protein GW17_00017396 [Ensete ventricosum]|nr:hypothetical protein GW17_00017396 [Ensete ventricosum]RZR77727.1 hypothetical protein BHM03_00002897 [Ensete ventricosum]
MKEIPTPRGVQIKNSIRNDMSNSGQIYDNAQYQLTPGTQNDQQTFTNLPATRAASDSVRTAANPENPCFSVTAAGGHRNAVQQGSRHGEVRDEVEEERKHTLVAEKRLRSRRCWSTRKGSVKCEEAAMVSGATEEQVRI